MTAATLVGVTVPAAPVDAQNAGWDDTTKRDAVLRSYDAEFGKPLPASGWTGDRASCNAGSTSQAYRDAIFARINWFRGMAGVPTGITENTSYSAKAQQSALMMSVSGKLSHTPDGSFGCFTASGASAASSSNLYLGKTGPDAITGYMYDPGAGNVSVGHRNWILHPTARQMGTGDIPNSDGKWASNDLWVFDNVFGSQPALREREGFVAWPPRGFVPSEVVFPRWSFSLRGANLASASVVMEKVGPDGSRTPIDTRIDFRNSTGGAPFAILVWQPNGIEPTAILDTTYRVTVNGAVVNGSTKSFSYDVTIIGEQPVNRISVDYTDFVNDAYTDFLGRNATPSESDYWNGALNGGMSRYDFVLALAGSEEWSAHIVDEMYIDTLGRPAEGAGKAYWVKQLRSGVPVAAIAGQFYGSPEYIANEGNSHEAWLRDLYTELLYRNPDGPGIGYWLSQVEIVGSTNVASTFYQSKESRLARVESLFVDLLDRAPDSAGHDFWAEVLLDGDDIALAANLAASDEYLNR